MTQSAELPPGLVKYAESPMFCAATVPDKLTSRHKLKPNVWGMLCVDAGSVKYHATGSTCRAATVSAGENIVIKPVQEHFVRPSDEALFKIEFYRRVDTGEST